MNFSNLLDWSEVEYLEWEVSYHSLGENMVSKKFLKFMFGLEKQQKQNIYVN